MLHNTGQFGNDVPINMNGQTNLTSMSDRLNIDNNINNLGKIVHEPPQGSTHFNTPDYSSYGLNMNANLGHFQYHPLGFQPAQNTIHNGWQNNMLPINLNAHSDHMLNYQYGKETLNEYKDLAMNKSLTTQVQTKAFHKQMGIDNYEYVHSNHTYNDYNLNLNAKLKPEQDLRKTDRNTLPNKGGIVTQNSLFLEKNIDLSSKPEKVTNNFAITYQDPDFNTANNKQENVNIDLSMKTQKADETPIRKYHEGTNNLTSQTTVELISDSYLNLSKSQKETTSFQFTNSDLGNQLLKDQDSRRRSLENTVKMIENILSHTSNSRKTDKSHNSQSNKLNNTIYQSNDSNSKSSLSSNYVPSDYNSDSSEDSTNNDTAKSMNKGNTRNQGTKILNEKACGSDSEDVKPLIIESNDNIDSSVVVKIEVIPCNVDTEHLNPFHRDIFGVKNEDVVGDVIDSENSVNVAKEVIRNGASVKSAYFECPHCFLYFVHPKRFLVHTKWHSFGLTNDKRMELQKEKEMQRHMKKEARAVERMKHCEVTDVNTPGRKFGCKDCDKVFSTKASLKNHRQRYHPTRTRDCKICGKTVPGWSALRIHLTTHTSESGYQCSDCPKRFKHPHSLAKHRDTHLEKTHACAQCPKKFGSAALLNVHMKTHERMLRGATFRCTYCAKGFFESYSLQVHERTHRNERPFLCEICNTSFGTNSSLKRHLKVSHSTSKPYECSTCHRSFISEAIRDRHSIRNHGDPEDLKFTCNQCPCKYLKMKDLRKHMYKVHPKGKRKRKQCSDSE